MIANIPSAGTITSVTALDGLDTEEWTLSNGARVVVKQTDFKNDEVIFGAWSPGGHSLVSDEHFMSAVNTSQVIGSSGIGAFDAVTLRKMLAGKVVSVSPSLSELSENFRGSASPKDLETLFQLTHLYFTAPRLDEGAVGALMQRIRAYLQNFKLSPEATFGDTVQVTLTDYHFRGRPMTPDLLDEIDMSRSFEIYKERFSDADDFVFFVIGAVDPTALRPLVETYLASLPATDREDTWKDIGMHQPVGQISKVVRKGLEPKAQVRLNLHGSFAWESGERFRFNALMEVLRIKLREVLREDKGGVYGVGINGSPSKYPRNEYSISIRFGCDPERVDELVDAVNLQMDSLAMQTADADYVTKVKEQFRRGREENLKQNGWWLNVFRVAYANGEDPAEILSFDEQIDGLTADDILDAAKTYFSRENYARIVLMPEVPEDQ